jgi:hypothetical protein
MMQFTILVVLPVVHFVLEAFHNYYVWKASTMKMYKYTLKWHTVDFYIKAVIYIAIILIYGDIWQISIIYLLYVSCIRVTIFNVIYNVLRGNKIYYFSSDSNVIDKVLHETPKLSYYGITVLSIVLLLTLIWIKIL